MVTLLGRPNVGKSTLFNRLTRSREALVDPTPGLTRDLRERVLCVEGVTLRLVDTGGVDFGSQDRMNSLVMTKSLEALSGSDLVIFMVDAKEGLTAGDKELFNLLRRLERPFLLVANKMDGPAHDRFIWDFFELGAGEPIAVSAEHSRGIKGLKEAMARRLEALGAARHCDMESAQAGGEMIRVALLGRPNVGKSSLLNRMIGEERMIVTDIAGTTRDSIDTLLKTPSGPDILLTDTAGIRRRSRVRQRIEKFSVLKSLEALKRSDMVIVVMDSSEGVTDQDKRLIGYTEQYYKACLTVYNKWDLISGDKALTRLRNEELRVAKRFIPYAPHLNISAKTGKNVSKIIPLLHEMAAQLKTTLNTGHVNKILREALAQRTPPIHKGHHVKLYYATQIGHSPPAFVIFANYPAHIPNHYKRFLLNQFRAALGVDKIPVKLVFRQRERRP